ncbi:DUF4440 domain-containing protein [Paenibacillus sp. P26]|nr:DUF4440 domain-containing protein [Paenibacillus sp. P26]
MTNPISVSKVMQPQNMNAAFAATYNLGGIDRLLALYEPDGILIGPDGRTRQGLPFIRKTLEELLELKGRMNSTNVYCIPFENMALLRAHFVIETSDADGNPLRLEGHTSEVVRKQQDGSWLYIVDHPAGAEISPPRLT